MKLLRQYGVVAHNFIAYSGAYMDPVDNNFNSEFRRRVNRRLSVVGQLRPLAGAEKLDIIREYYEYSVASSLLHQDWSHR